MPGQYYISAILRRDGSSRFGQNNRYGYFPGVNAAWRISEEAFMSGQGMVSDLKLRASYRITGNQEIGNYAFTSMYYTNISTSSYPIAGDPNSVTQGISKETIGNPDIKWEKTTQANIGLDVGFLNNNLTFELDLYYKYTSDILQQVTYPATGGVASSPYENIGEMRNNGFEFNANYRKTTSKDFSFETGVILSGYRNKVKKLASDQFIASGDYNRTEVGRPISSFYGYIIDGIFSNPGRSR
ncbi:MAG: TonB-dependent receptor [Tannerellaceae bacterium]|nr:TonB-dependent receptor [Tannerellaceae bacterium]